MAFSEKRIVIGGLAHFPVFIFIANFINGMFGVKTEEAIETISKKEPIKVIQAKKLYLKKRNQNL